MFSFSEKEFLIKIAVAMLCGTIVGLERQLRGKPVGIRTSTIICIGTVTFFYLGELIPGPKDSARVLGHIIQGVGFLGAGVMMNKEGLVLGVTSAATIWLLAAVGVAIGLNQYTMAITVSLVTVCILYGVEYLERMFNFLRRGVHNKKHVPYQ